jgi:sortase B
MDRDERKARRRFEKKQIISAAVLLCIMFVSLYYVAYDEYKRQKNEKIYEQMRVTESTEEQDTEEIEVTEEPETETEDPTVYCEKLYDFDELREQNEDIYAWIVVPGTQVDYPVLQCDTDNYYLDYNVDGSRGYPACIYTNKCNFRDFSDYITVLYGHNMKNGSMFGCLHSFEDEEFFEENDSIIVYTEQNRLTYQIYAAVKYNDNYIPSYFDVRSETDKFSFIDSLEEYMDETESHKRDGVEIEEGDRIITLSTCVSGERPRRYLVIGKLIETAKYEQ